MSTDESPETVSEESRGSRGGWGAGGANPIAEVRGFKPMNEQIMVATDTWFDNS